MYEIQTHQFRSPRGHHVSMDLRADTNDWNTLNSCLTEDEYGLHNLQLTGRALDIGAYIGGVTVAMLVDNPELLVTAVEPVPSNVNLLHRNLALNEVADRCTVVDGAVGDGRKLNIRYGYTGSELATHHAFVGNVSFLKDPAPENPHEVRRLTGQKLSALGTFDFAKIDCEGCEWNVDLTGVRHIRGEWHPTAGHVQADVAAMLPDHDVTFTGPLEGPGGFEAVRR